MTDLAPLTSDQQALMVKYCQAREVWESGSVSDLARDGALYAAALKACLDAGFDPFHHPAPQ